MAKLKAEDKFGTLYVFSEDSMLSFTHETSAVEYRGVFRKFHSACYQIKNQRNDIKTRILLPIGVVNMAESLTEVKNKLKNGRVYQNTYSSWRFRDARRHLKIYGGLLLSAVERDTEENADCPFALKDYYKKNFWDFYICLDVLENTGVLVNRIVFDKLAHKV